MRAIRLSEHGGPEELRVEEIDRPEPGADELLVEIEAAGVNPVDTYFRDGSYEPVGLPFTPGVDFAGTVAECGDGVEGFDVGDRVYGTGIGNGGFQGAYAEYAAVPTDRVVELPDDAAMDEAGGAGVVACTAWRALIDHADLDPAEYCLVHGGSGGVGHMAVQIAAESGAEVITTAGTADARARLEADLGASVALDYESDSLAEEILAATDGAGVETVLDHRLEEYLDLDLEVVRPGGQIISTMGHIPATNGRPFYNKEVTIQPLKMDNRERRTDILDPLMRLLERDAVTAVVDSTYALDEAAQAQRDILAGGSLGKLVVTP